MTQASAQHQMSGGRVRKVVCRIFIAVGTLAALYGGFQFVSSILSSDGSKPLKPAFPPGGPAEFMYLDNARVAAYLAQVDGGTYDSEKLTRKLTQSLNAKIALEKAGEVGGSVAEEEFAERSLKPTAASSFFALRSALKKNNALQPVRLRHFRKEVEGLTEGQFVEFKTSSLLPPLYLNAYLAIKHAHSVASLFPRSTIRREATRNFMRKVGREPRAVFSLQPYVAEPRQNVGDANSIAAASTTTEREPFVYLLPISVQLLNPERSLLKYGGGRFTVIGKLVRRFPEPTRSDSPAYVDSATLETWRQPLRHAPGELLCRTAPSCAAKVRDQELTGASRREAASEARARILHALNTQIRIDRDGAVILPIAIYK